MKVKYAEFIFTVLLCFVLIFNMVFIAIDGLGGSLDNLPEGELVFSAQSEKKDKTLNIYTTSLSGVGNAVRGEVLWSDGTTKNIYWCINETECVATWQDENTVLINGNYIALDGEPFDSRKRIELPEASYKNLVSEK